MRRCLVLFAVLVTSFRISGFAVADSLSFVAGDFQDPVVRTWGPLGVSPSIDLTHLLEHGGWTFFGSAPESFTTASSIRSLDRNVNFYIGIGQTNSPYDPISEAFDSIAVSISIKGSINQFGPLGVQYAWPSMWGGFTTTNVSTSLVSIPGAPPPPPELLNLLQNPDRIHLSGVLDEYDTAYYTLDATLVIDPPGPGSPTTVPEPGTLLIMAAGLLLVHPGRRTLLLPRRDSEPSVSTR